MSEEYSVQLTFSAEVQALMDKLQGLTKAATDFGAGSTTSQGQFAAAVDATQAKIQQLKERLVELYAQRSTGDQTADLRNEITITEKALVGLNGEMKKYAELQEKGGEESESWMGHLGMLAFGFGSLAAAGEKALELLMDGLKEVVKFIPESIEQTNQLVEVFKALHITAGMTVDDFNAYTAAIMLAGGKAEDLTTIVQGMERGIRQHSENLVANGVFASEAALKQATLGEYISKVTKAMESYGDTTSKDALLMEAFGRGGMAFAAQLVEINEHMKEGQALGEKEGIITEKAVADQKALVAAKAEVAHAEKAYKAVVSDAAIGIDIAYQKMKAAAIEAQTERLMADHLAEQGLIKYEGTTNLTTGLLEKDYGRMVAAARAYLQEQKDLNKAQEEGLETIKKLDAAEMAMNGRHDAENRGTGGVKNPDAYDPNKAQKEKDAKDAAAKAAQTNQEVLNALQEQGNRLKAEDLKTTVAITLEEQRLKADQEAGAKLEEERRRIDAELAKGNTKGNRKQADKDRELAEKAYQDQIQANQAKFDQERQAEAEKLDGQLSAIEARGEAQQIAQIKAHFAQMREEAVKKNQDQATLARIDMDQQVAIQKAMDERVMGDMKKLQTGLTELAKVKGHALSMDEQLTELKRLQAELGLSAKAVGLVRAELERTQSAKAGWNAALVEWANKLANVFQMVKSSITEALNGIGNAFSSTMTNVVTGTTKASAAMHELFAGITKAIVQAMSNLVVQYAEGKIAGLGFFKSQETASLEQANAQKTASSLIVVANHEAGVSATEAAAAGTEAAAQNVANSAANVAAADASSTALELEAGAGIWSAYASIPFVGEALAIGAIGLMEASLAEVAATPITALAQGTIVDRPLFAMLGEAGREVVMPETNFMDYFTSTMNMGANLAASQISTQQQIQSYDTAHLGFNSTANSSTTNHRSSVGNTSSSHRSSGPLVQQVFNGPVYDPSQLATQAHANMVVKAVTRGAQSRGWRINTDQSWGAGS